MSKVCSCTATRVLQRPTLRLFPSPYRNMATISITKGTMPAEAQSNPHHVLRNDGSIKLFKNPYPSFQREFNFGHIFREVMWPALIGRIPRPDLKNHNIKVRKPEFLPTRENPSSRVRATWLGHACYFVEYPSGLRVLFDPVFQPCCGPYGRLGPPRYTPAPCELKDIPIVDAVVISHSHYDHLCSKSCLEIAQHNPKAQFFAGLGLEKWFKGIGIKNVTEMDWWHDAEFTVPTASGNEISATISCLPSQHTSARTPFDQDTTLWCSWAVKSAGKNVWFGGDTGYRGVPYVEDGKDDYDMSDPELAKLPKCPQFSQLGELRGPFDLGLIPIGAYRPRGLFSSIHANPFDAVEMFKDSKTKRAMGIHWGTWELTPEEVMEPPKLLKEALKRHGLTEHDFGVCDIGESREF